MRTAVLDPETLAPVVKSNWHHALFSCYALIIATFGGFGLWAATAPLDSAVIVNGIIAVESSKKTIQHLEGGIVRQILVHNGQHVMAGDILVRLDPTRAEAQAETYEGELAIALASEARLVAQRDDAEQVTFPQEVLTSRNDPAVAQAINDQTRQFDETRANYKRQADVAAAQIIEIQKEEAGYKEAAETARGQIVFVAKELDGLRSLYAKQLTEYSRLADAEKEQLQLNGQIAQSAISEAQSAEKINEIKLQQEQLKQQNREQASKDLVDVRKQISDLRQQILVSADELKRVEIRAPTEGTIQELRIFTIGGIVKPGDPILDIVPAKDDLVVQAQIPPLQADVVSAGMTAEVRFPSFHGRNVPYIKGIVTTMSRDTLQDPNDPRQTYFAAEIGVDKSTIPSDLRARLSAGLPAEVIITTGERTALEYLSQPIMERFRTAMHEQ